MLALSIYLRLTLFLTHCAISKPDPTIGNLPSIQAEIEDLSADILEITAKLANSAEGNTDLVLAGVTQGMDNMQRDMKRLKDAFSIGVKRSEWMVTILSHDLDEKHKLIDFELKDLKKRIEKGELADRIGRWVEIYSRRTLTTEPELTQTLRDIREWSEKVDAHISKDDKFTWLYLLLFGLVSFSLLVYRQAHSISKSRKRASKG